MILDVLAYRNKKLKSYANPVYVEAKLETIEVSITRAIVSGGEEALKKFKNLALYHFGTFDDQTGKYDLFKEPELICDCDDIIASIPESEE